MEMNILTLSKRVTKEILREPINMFFGLGFPLVLLLIMSLIQSNIPVSLFEIESLAPGVSVFGLSFMSLFSATLISKDRSSSFLKRLYTSPLKAYEFILSYALPVIPISLMQTVICYIVSFFLGLELNINVIYSIISIFPISLLYIGIGILCGSVLSDKAVGGVCGALLTNVSAWLSGIWFDLDLIGGTFKDIANLLPFVHAVELEREILIGDFSNLWYHLFWVLGYTLIILILASILFIKQMKDN